MPLSKVEVQHIADLARLQLSEAELTLYASQLSSILEYAAKLDAVDTSDISPTATVLPIDTVLRADQVKPGLDRDELLKHAARSQDGMFKVSAAIEGGRDE